jgi:hypothetical protein
VKTQRSYRAGDLGGVFLVGESAPARMTNGDMLDFMSFALASGCSAQRDYFSSLKLETGHLVERASDCRRLNLL